MRPKEIYQITLLTWPHIPTTLVLAFYLQNHPSTTPSLKPTQHLYCFADISLLWILQQQSWNFITNENFISTFCVSVFRSIEEGHKSKFAQFSFIITIGNLELHSSHPLFTNAFLLYPVPYFLHVPAKRSVSNQWQKSNIVLHLGFIISLHGQKWMHTLVTKRCNKSYIVTNEWNLGVWQGLGQIPPLFQTSFTFFEYPSQLEREKHVYKNNSPTIFNNQIR